MKVVYLIEQHLDERNRERFGLQAWVDAGWTVEVWNLTPMARSDVWRAIKSLAPAKSVTAWDFTLASKSDVESRLSAGAKFDYFIDFAGDNNGTVWVKKRLARGGAVRVVGHLGSIPPYERRTKISFLAKVRKAFSAGFSFWRSKVAQKANAFVVKHLIPPGVIVVSGSHSYRAASKVYDERQIIRAHSFDYDSYLRLVGEVGHAATSLVEPYAVFIDQDLCYHPEYVYANLAPYATPESYFPAMRRGLLALAEATGLDLKIAAHPRASYQQRGSNSFEPIPIVHGDTASLIRDSKVVVAHTSTALQAAILFRKPVIFATTDELGNSWLGPYISTFAATFGKNVINFSSDLGSIDWAAELQVDDDRYVQFRREFIKMDGTANRPLWSIVIDRLQSDMTGERSAPDLVSPVSGRP